jgi:hypothetical protein
MAKGQQRKKHNQQQKNIKKELDQAKTQTNQIIANWNESHSLASFEAIEALSKGLAVLEEFNQTNYPGFTFEGSKKINKNVKDAQKIVARWQEMEQAIASAEKETSRVIANWNEGHSLDSFNAVGALSKVHAVLEEYNQSPYNELNLQGISKINDNVQQAKVIVAQWENIAKLIPEMEQAIASIENFSADYPKPVAKITEAFRMAKDQCFQQTNHVEILTELAQCIKETKNNLPFKILETFKDIFISIANTFKALIGSGNRYGFYGDTRKHIEIQIDDLVSEIEAFNHDGIAQNI